MAKKAIKPKKSSPTRPKKGLYIFHVYGHFTLQLTLDETEVVCEGGDIEPRESVVREQENIIEELLAESSDVQFADGFVHLSSDSAELIEVVEPTSPPKRKAEMRRRTRKSKLQ